MGIKENLRILKTNDNINIAFWNIYNTEDSLKGNIFLNHGFFSNKKICMGIAKYFVKLGYTETKSLQKDSIPLCISFFIENFF